MIKEATIKLINKENLTYDESREVMNEIMSGKATDIKIAAYLTALSSKGENIDEITGSAMEMRAHALKMKTNLDDVFEIVGTGGDGSKTFNISTTSSIVISSSGVNVAKHGNRAASSNCGAADCLESLGVNINLLPEKSISILNDIGICFLFAQKYHSSMRYVSSVRKEIGIRTIFNILGPLTNPAHANIQLLGVYSKDLVEPLAHVLSKLGVKKGMSVFGQDVLDEISMSAPTTICEFEDGNFKTYEVCPEDFGLKRCNKEDLVGGDPEQNAMITIDILNGVKGPKRDAVLLNSGAGLYLCGKADNIKEGVELAAELIDSGKAREKLEQFIELSNRGSKL